VARSSHRHTVLALIAALAGVAALISDTAAQPAAQTHTIPDWNGVWVIAGDFMDKQDGKEVAAPGRFDPSRKRDEQHPVYKGVYLQKFLAVKQAIKAGKPIGDRGALCLPQGMPAFWEGPYSFEILQTPTQINISQEWNQQTRRIYLNEHQQPADPDPTYNGHSIGHWEGDVLVVDTVAVREDTHMTGDSGGPHSDAMHITERLEPEGRDLLKVVMTIDDPKAFLQPYVETIHLHRKAGMEMMEYVCEENNRNPVDTHGVTGVKLQK
jgi:hypothetical protein